MGLFSKIKDFLRGSIYRINREVLADYMNNEIQFSVEHNLSACEEFYLSPSEGETEEHKKSASYDISILPQLTDFLQTFFHRLIYEEKRLFCYVFLSLLTSQHI